MCVPRKPLAPVRRTRLVIVAVGGVDISDWLGNVLGFVELGMYIFEKSNNS